MTEGFKSKGTMGLSLVLRLLPSKHHTQVSTVPMAWSRRRRMRYTYSEATTTDLKTHELNKCYYLMPHWFYSVWLHSITVAIANWYNHLLAIWHPASYFTFLNLGFLINKRKQFFTVCWDQSWSIVFCTQKMLKNDKVYVITIFTKII